VKRRNGEECDSVDELADEELQQVPKFDKAVSGFEVVRRQFCFIKNDDNCLSRLDHLKKSCCHYVIILHSNNQGIQAGNSLCTDT
jgi:hypothetical protein